MERYQATLAYDGTNFSGFQRQKKVRTVQGEIEKALTQIGWSGQSILAAGRTDTGVHARGQVISFDLLWRHDLVDLRNALNATLPEEISVGSVFLVDRDFHPRFDAVARRYLYRIYCSPVRDPFQERHAWRLSADLELEALQKAAERLVGNHDFSAFGSPTQAGGTTRRSVMTAQWARVREGYQFEIEANAFLYHMVRRIVHLLVVIGRGIESISTVSDYLAAGKIQPVQGLAPAKGLSLEFVRYPDRIIEER